MLPPTPAQLLNRHGVLHGLLELTYTQRAHQSTKCFVLLLAVWESADRRSPLKPIVAEVHR